MSEFRENLVSGRWVIVLTSGTETPRQAWNSSAKAVVHARTKEPITILSVRIVVAMNT